MFVKKIISGALIFLGHFGNFLCADFEKSAKSLMPIDQLEAKINSVATEAGIGDWNERFERFKKHLHVLKSENEFKAVMDSVKNSGFSESFPLRGWEVLNILGFKPWTEPGEWALSNRLLWKKVEDLIREGKLLDIKDKDKRIASRPTIPFKIVFESYKTDDATINEKLWKNSTFDAKTFCDDFDSKENQAEILIEAKDKIGVLTSETAYGQQSIDALLLGLQPLVTLVKVNEVTMNFFIKNLYHLLGLEEFQVSDSVKTKIKDFKNWGWYDNTNKRYMLPGFIRSLSFCSNPKNYRLLLYAGFKFYNDNSPYIILIGYLCEFFFRTAFSDECFLNLLYVRLTSIVKKATDFSIEIGANGCRKFILKNGFYDNSSIPKNYELKLTPYAFDTWKDFKSAKIGPLKESLSLEQKQSYPPIIPTFKEFLKRAFGSEGECWTWNDAAPKNSLMFVDEKKDQMLVQFLEYVENGVASKLQVLHTQLHVLQIKLKALTTSLENLKNSLELTS